MLAPPPEGWLPHLGGILDPSLCQEHVVAKGRCYKCPYARRVGLTNDIMDSGHSSVNILADKT